MSYPTVINGLDFRDLIFVADNDPVTDSFMVAKAFGKLPKNVIRDIERTIEACPPEFDTKLNFELCYKNNELQNGKPQKFYRLRKDGLMLLVMSYTKKRGDAYQDRLHQRLQLDVRDASGWAAPV